MLEWLPRGWGRPWDWVQVEVSSRCNARCLYCPHATLAPHWQGRLMDLDTFRRFLPALKRARLVHLQGWGEPLLNPDFWSMLRLARGQGCRVGTTTNATLLDAETARRMVAEGLEVVGLSLAGVDQRNDEIRRGTSLTQVLRVMEHLAQAKARAGSELPAVHVAYLALRSRLKDVTRLPGLLKDRGVAAVVVSTLDLVTSPELAAEALWPQDQAEYQRVEAILATAAQEAAQAGLAWHHQLAHPPGGRLGPCTENVDKAMVVSAAGQVMPCVFHNLSAPRPLAWQEGGMRPWRQERFGDVNQESLEDIWRGRGYRAFRDSLGRGSPPPGCRVCPKLRMAR